MCGYCELAICLYCLCLVVRNSLMETANSEVETTRNDTHSDIVVRLEDGLIKGYATEDYFGSQVYGFQSVPYANPPTGNLRFESPQPRTPWEGVWDATTTNNICFQWMENGTLNGSEDCLYLHIYTKSLREDALKPVMVWLHGGSFRNGGHYNGYGSGFLMTKDIVLVYIQYRLGPFGFLCFEDENNKTVGNYGLKDQILALKWIQKNIVRFGGDPNRVTLFGESAGGASIHLLILTPMSEGLFHKAIIQSGHADILQADRGKYIRYAEILSCEATRNMIGIRDCLREIPAEKIMAADLEFRISAEYDDVAVPSLGVVIETPGEYAFLTDSPENIIKSGKFNHIPAIIGYCYDDGVIANFMKPRAPPNITNYEMLIPMDIDLKPNSKEADKLGKRIKQFYWGSQVPDKLNDQYLLYQTDNYFLRPMMTFTELHLNYSNAPIYFYEFRYNSELNFNWVKDYYRPLTVHADADNYLFVSSRTPNKMTPESDAFIGMHRIVSLWTTFASSLDADPNPITGSDPLIDVQWNPVNIERFNYLSLSPDFKEKEHLARDRMIFWKKIYQEYKKKQRSELRKMDVIVSQGEADTTNLEKRNGGKLRNKFNDPNIAIVIGSNGWMVMIGLLVITKVL